MKKKECDCDKNCYCRINDEETMQCCYYSNGRCIANEYSENYLFKMRR